MICYVCSSHLDHVASLPYFLEKAEKVCSSDNTFFWSVTLLKSIQYLFRQQCFFFFLDYIEIVGKKFTSHVSYNILVCKFSVYQVIDLHQTLEVNGICLWCYTAGHVLGAAMFMFDIAGVRVLYTGNFSWEEDSHLRAAELPQFSPNMLSSHNY